MEIDAQIHTVDGLHANQYFFDLWADWQFGAVKKRPFSIIILRLVLRYIR